MRRLFLLMASASVIVLAASKARAWDRGRVQTFAVLPPGSSGPEGLEVDSSGQVYVTTFGFTAGGEAAPPGQLFVFNERGRLLRQLGIAGSSAHLLGLRFHPITGALLVIDFGSQKVLDVNPSTGASSVFMTLPALPHPDINMMAGLNDVTFDRAGNVYISDSFQGVVWKTGQSGGEAAVWVDDELLRTKGVPPFGANGLRFNHDETALFVANTGNNTVVRVPITGGSPGAPAIFVNGVHGADGMIIDDHDNLWLAANQADEIVVLDPTGRAIAKLGDFDGVTDRGMPIHLLFPASLRFSGRSLLVTNLSLDLRLFNPVLFPTDDSQWAAQVSRYTIVKLPARIPPISGSPDDDEGGDD